MTIDKGMFISLEGIDGAGKSTQSALLASWFQEQGKPALLTREPGGTARSEVIRKLLVERPQGYWSLETEILLYNAARQEHVERKIRPALSRGETVICDRFVDSTRIYQARSSRRLRCTVDLLHDRLIGLDPQLTVILDMDPRKAGERRAGQGSADPYIEGSNLDMTEVRSDYLKLASEFPERCRRVDAAGTIEEVAVRIRKIVQNWRWK